MQCMLCVCVYIIHSVHTFRHKLTVVFYLLSSYPYRQHIMKKKKHEKDFPVIPFAKLNEQQTKPEKKKKKH